jgi:hypothetical protein
MKKLVIYKDVFNEGKKKVERRVLRSITPGPTFVGYGKNGTINSNEFKKLAQALEPGMTGHYVA